MQFSKMHGLGNDFMVIDGVTQNVFLTPDIIRQLSDRHRGIGFDQLLLVEPPYDPELDFTTAFLTPMAAKFPNVATVRAVLPVS